MTSGLRKAHKYSWLILAIALPMVIILAVKDLDVFSQKKAVKATFKASKGTIVKTSENEILKASLIKNDHLFALEIILKKPLKQPSLVLESVNPNGVPAVIGQLSSVGMYTFKIDEATESIRLRDFLKEKDAKIITELSL